MEIDTVTNGSYGKQLRPIANHLAIGYFRMASIIRFITFVVGAIRGSAIVSL